MKACSPSCLQSGSGAGSSAATAKAVSSAAIPNSGRAKWSMGSLPWRHSVPRSHHFDKQPGGQK